MFLCLFVFWLLHMIGSYEMKFYEERILSFYPLMTCPYDWETWLMEEKNATRYFQRYLTTFMAVLVYDLFLPMLPFLYSKFITGFHILWPLDTYLVDWFICQLILSKQSTRLIYGWLMYEINVRLIYSMIGCWITLSCFETGWIASSMDILI